MMRQDGIETAPASLHRAAFREIEIALLVRLQVKSELVEVRRDNDIAVEDLEIVGLAVAVKIDELCDLVAAVHINFAFHYFEPERLKQPRGDAPPFQFFPIALKPAYNPHIAIPRGNRSGVRIDEIEAAEAHIRIPGVVEGECDRIGGVRLFRITGYLASRGDGLRPDPRPAGSEGFEIGLFRQYRFTAACKCDACEELALSLRHFRKQPASFRNDFHALSGILDSAFRNGALLIREDEGQIFLTRSKAERPRDRALFLGERFKNLRAVDHIFERDRLAMPVMTREFPMRHVAEALDRALVFERSVRVRPAISGGGGEQRRAVLTPEGDQRSVLARPRRSAPLDVTTIHGRKPQCLRIKQRPSIVTEI